MDGGPHTYRCFVDRPELAPGDVELSPSEARHLFQVRRARPGTEVSVLNGRGVLGSATVAQLDKRGGTVRIHQVERHAPPTPEVVLVLGALKQSAWLEFLKHAVELGVNRVVRLQSQHAVSDVPERKREQKHARWTDCMVQACKQSANPWLPELSVADSVESAANALEKGAIHVLADLGKEARGWEEVPPAAGRSIVCWVGPEGDFTEEERRFLRSEGVLGISLGPRILRSETAALTLLAGFRLRG